MPLTAEEQLELDLQLESELGRLMRQVTTNIFVLNKQDSYMSTNISSIELWKETVVVIVQEEN